MDIVSSVVKDSAENPCKLVRPDLHIEQRMFDAVGHLGGAARHWLGGFSLRQAVLEDDIVHVSLGSRFTKATGFHSSTYLVGDLLIDSSFSLAGHLLVEHLSTTRLSAICLTHHHEDHSGNCGRIARAQQRRGQTACPIYLEAPEHRFTDGVSELLPYRRLFWGPPTPYDPVPVPDEIIGESRRLVTIPTPGHSRTHVAYFEEETGALFSGDLYVSTGASAIMKQENPHEAILSLRTAAALEPKRMFTGHGLIIDEPADKLLTKAERIEEAATRVRELNDAGLDERAIERRIFPSGERAERFGTILTNGEFSRRNFIQACLEYH